MWCLVIDDQPHLAPCPCTTNQPHLVPLLNSNNRTAHKGWWDLWVVCVNKPMVHVCCVAQVCLVVGGGCASTHTATHQHDQQPASWVVKPARHWGQHASQHHTDQAVLLTTNTNTKCFALVWCVVTPCCWCFAMPCSQLATGHTTLCHVVISNQPHTTCLTICLGVC